MSNELERERALREFLDGKSELGRQYASHSNEEPPEALDRAILTKARDALAGERGFGRRWRAPLALAASAILAVGVVLQIIETGMHEASIDPVAERAVESLQLKPLRQRAPQDRKDGPVRAERSSEPEAALLGSAADGESSGARFAAPPPQSQSPGTAASADQSGQWLAAPGARPERPPREATGNTPPYPLAKRDAQESGLAAGRQMGDEALPVARASAPRAAAEPAISGPQPAATAAHAAELGVSGPQAAAVAASATAPGVTSRPDAREEAELRDADSFARMPKSSLREGLAADALQSAAPPRPAQDWLDEIEGLVEETRLEEARDMLVEFRKSYPDWPLGDTLRELEP